MPQFYADIDWSDDNMKSSFSTVLIASLLEAGFAVFPVNPNTIDRRRTASGAKTDRIDAYLLAKTG